MSFFSSHPCKLPLHGDVVSCYCRILCAVFIPLSVQFSAFCHPSTSVYFINILSRLYKHPELCLESRPDNDRNSLTVSSDKVHSDGLVRLQPRYFGSWKLIHLAITKTGSGESRNGTGNGRARIGGDKNQQAERECEGMT